MGVAVPAGDKFVMGMTLIFFVCIWLARWRRALFSATALHMHSSTSTAFVPEPGQSRRFRICTRRYALPPAAPVAYWRAPQ